MEDNTTPDTEKKKELKSYSFTRNIPNNAKNGEIQGKNELTLNLTLKLYDKEISLKAQKENINSKLLNIKYEKYISLETLQGMNKLFSVLDTEKIFDIIKSGFEQKFDKISLEEDKIIIKLMINFMEVMKEEIIFELEKRNLSSEEENIIIKESIKLLTEDKKNLKNEVAKLSNIIVELKKTTSEKDDQIKKQLEDNKNVYTNKIEENKKEFEKKLEEYKTEFSKKLEEYKNEFAKKLEEKEKENQEKEQENKKNINEFQNILKKLQQEMSEVKEIKKYVKEKIIIKEKIEKEIKSCSLQRKKTIDSYLFDLDIKILLFNEKIKFKIKEIQDNLKNNPILYETDFEMNYFGKLSDYYKNQGGIKSIFDFLIFRFNDNEDIINRKANKIIIKVKYTFGSKEDEIIFEINKKEIGLKNILTNVDETLRVLNKDIIKNNQDIIKNNKDIIEAKEEFKKNILEKVYPIGSYYWSERDISPGNLFGGRWTKIEGRFLFASDSNHKVGETGGEERHQLTIDEMPSHSHGYQKFKYKGGWCINHSNDYLCLACDDQTKNLESSTTNSTGNSQSHNNMPPYLTANCWKRVG